MNATQTSTAARERVLPNVGAMAELVIPQLGRFRARVEAAVTERLLLSLYQAPDTPMMLFEYYASVVFDAPDGSHELFGTVRRTSATTRLHFHNHPDEQHQERRQDLRVRATLALELTVPRDPSPIRAQTLDISAGGLLIRHDSQLHSGDEVSVALELPDHKPPIKVSGRVAREVGPDVAGIRLVKIAPGDQRRINRFIFLRQWETRQMSEDDQSSLEGWTRRATCGRSGTASPSARLAATP